MFLLKKIHRLRKTTLNKQSAHEKKTRVIPLKSADNYTVPKIFSSLKTQKEIRINCGAFLVVVFGAIKRERGD